MENASKALLIAGSVLVVILLIAFGMRIFNSSNQGTEEIKTTMNTQEVATFNSKFTKYIGTNKTRGNALALYNDVISNNGVNANHRVFINSVDPTSIDPNTLFSVQFYNINILGADYNSQGYVYNVRIAQVP